MFPLNWIADREAKEPLSEPLALPRQPNRKNRTNLPRTSMCPRRPRGSTLA